MIMAYAPMKERIGYGDGGKAQVHAASAAFSRKAEPEGILKAEFSIGKSTLNRVEGPPVTYRNERHAYSPQELLILAVIRGDMKAAKAAINDGACIRHRALIWIPAPDSPPGETRYYYSRSETTPLLLAKHMGRTEMMEFLKKTSGREQHGS